MNNFISINIEFVIIYVLRLNNLLCLASKCYELVDFSRTFTQIKALSLHLECFE